MAHDHESRTRMEGTRRTSGRVEQPTASITLPKGGGAIRGIGEKFARQPRHRHRLDDRADRDLARALRLRPAAFALVRLGPAMVPSASAGPCRCRRSPGRRTRACRGTATPKNPTSSSSPAPRTWCRVLDAGRQRFERRHDARPATSIHRYRPRIEGLFARIERWTQRSDGDVHWRSISRDNILTVYGRDAESRIADPADPAVSSPG